MALRIAAGLKPATPGATGLFTKTTIGALVAQERDVVVGEDLGDEVDRDVLLIGRAPVVSSVSPRPGL